MKQHKIDGLFSLARADNPPAASEDFAERVIHQIRRDKGLQPISFFEQVNALFPRLALTAGVLIVLCIGLDIWCVNVGSVDLDEGIARISAEWLLL